jgi:molecular chaperone DnaK (HSP70)
MAFDDKSIKVVVGIDFGTSRSGYAYAFLDDKKIIPKTQWPGQGVPYAKTFTQILYSPDRQQKWWGCEARMVLAAKRKMDEAKHYHFFERFKMSLCESKDRTSEGPRITSSAGEKFLTVDVIADYLRFLKDFAWEEITEATSGHLKEKEIRWCLTVPAIWTDADKQLMRRAAQKAGIIGTSEDEAERLILALEPEAAAMYCQERDQHELKEGSRFMVVDAGGGTVDITVHEVLPGKKLREVATGTGGACGSTYVDRYFVNEFLSGKLTSKVIESYYEEEPVDFLEMMDDWEHAKCNLDPTKKRFFPIRTKLYKILKDYPDVLDKLADEQDGEDESIYIFPETMKQIFKSTLDGLVQKVHEQFEKLGGTGCDIMYLVGGFSTSPLLQERIRQEFSAKVQKIVIPPSPGAAVVEGAVSFGIDPSIRSRVSRLTYGARSADKFKKGKDPLSKKFWSEEYNEHYCYGRFAVFIEAGDEVGIDEKVMRTYTPMEKDQKEMPLKFYATKKFHPRYIDEQGVTKLGELTIERSDTSSGLNWEIEVSMYFGRTEIQVEAKDVKTGKSEKTSLRFSSTYSSELIEGQ